MLGEFYFGPHHFNMTVPYIEKKFSNFSEGMKAYGTVYI